MPRNRMIKPQFWEDEKISAISRDARLTYIAMWNFSDDYGVIKGNSMWLKNNIFPYENGLLTDIFQSWLSELKALKRIVPFDFNGETFYYLPFFLKHQTINRPSAQRNPSPPDNIMRDSLSNT